MDRTYLLSLDRVTTDGNIVVLGGSRIGDATQQWYIAPLTNPTAKATMQNAGTLQYLSVPGVPANDTAVLPSADTFVWSVNRSGQQGIKVDGTYYLTDRVGVVPVRFKGSGTWELKYSEAKDHHRPTFILLNALDSQLDCAISCGIPPLERRDGPVPDFSRQCSGSHACSAT